MALRIRIHLAFYLLICLLYSKTLDYILKKYIIRSKWCQEFWATQKSQAHVPDRDSITKNGVPCLERNAINIVINYHIFFIQFMPLMHRIILCLSIRISSEIEPSQFARRMLRHQWLVLYHQSYEANASFVTMVVAWILRYVQTTSHV